MKEYTTKMDKALEKLKLDLSRLRTGRASSVFVEGVMVNYYGTKTPLKQVANISIPDARMIQIQPWEPPLCKDIEKAILEANLGFTPTSDGKLVRIVMPQMTEERREDLVKQVKKLGEDSKVAVRQIRKDANADVKKSLDSKTISEDESKRNQDQIQKETDKFIANIDDIIHKKSEEIRTI